jgi:hypothetical protein
METKALQMIRKISLGGSLLMVVFLCGCNSSLSNTKENIKTESVMKEGDRIVATNTFGTLTITAGRDNIRYLTLSGKDVRGGEWLGDTVKVKLTARKTQDNKKPIELVCNTNIKMLRSIDETEDSKNIYGPIRVEMTEEPYWNFDNLQSAKEVLNPNSYKANYDPHIWSSDGLYIFWSYGAREYWFIPTPLTLYIRLSQIYIDREKASDIPPAPEYNKITVEHLTGEQLKELEKSVKPFFYFF